MLSDKLLTLDEQLCQQINLLEFDSEKVEYVYNPLEYAYNGYSQFVKKYLDTSKHILFVGMNPGPYGMCQTGIPFGDVNTVQNWFEINVEVNRPRRECPERPVLGLECKRVEQSGKRLWEYFRKKCGLPEHFFRNAFILNYCPLGFFDANGKNITPNNLKVANKRKIQQICDQYMLHVLQLLECKIVVGIGRYAQERMDNILKTSNLDVQLLYMKHPSPLAGTTDQWIEDTNKLIQENNLNSYFINKHV
ncbi:PREDICTED: single-strand selective monofunctional uracil DNA glycosylase-like [Nicrophorus vespilloides]|uniref:Single-strand selective monofunctional uracil DNA glycosylase-like n=1 Tax=Nicrophorus vespilloides TaxID=110193 RepID=A0ABM1MHY8_NICVS|nr:PREDICTED: single-strand selective monofunctional uracil DNA glycosylase-like [Nicrophorus vespilloides]